MKRLYNPPTVDELYNGIIKKLKSNRKELSKMDYLKEAAKIEKSNEIIMNANKSEANKNYAIAPELLTLPRFGQYAENQWSDRGQYEIAAEQQLEFNRALQEQYPYMTLLAVDAPNVITDSNVWNAWQSVNHDIPVFVDLLKKNKIEDFNTRNSTRQLAKFNRTQRQAKDSKTLRSEALNDFYKPPTKPARHVLVPLKTHEFHALYRVVNKIERGQLLNDARLADEKLIKDWIEKALEGHSGNLQQNAYRLSFAILKTDSNVANNVRLFLAYRNKVFDTNETLEMIISNMTNKQLPPLSDERLVYQEANNIFNLINTHVSEEPKYLLYDKYDLVYLPFSKLLKAATKGQVPFRDTKKWDSTALDETQKKDFKWISLNTSFATASLINDTSTLNMIVNQLIGSLEDVVNRWIMDFLEYYRMSGHQYVDDMMDIVRESQNFIEPERHKKLDYLAKHFYNAIDMDSALLFFYILSYRFFHQRFIALRRPAFSAGVYTAIMNIMDKQKVFMSCVVDNLPNLFNASSNVSVQAKIETIMVMSTLYNNNANSLPYLVSEYSAFATEGNPKTVKDFCFKYSTFIKFDQNTAPNAITKKIHTMQLISESKEIQKAAQTVKQRLEYFEKPSFNMDTSQNFSTSTPLKNKDYVDPKGEKNLIKQEDEAYSPDTRKEIDDLKAQIAEKKGAFSL